MKMQRAPLNPIFISKIIKPQTNINMAELQIVPFDTIIERDDKVWLKELNVNKFKALLEKYKGRLDWDKSTRYYNLNDLTFCIKQELKGRQALTNGYIKMMEMCFNFDVDLFGTSTSLNKPKRRTIKGLFLAEFPGYFMQAMNTYLTDIKRAKNIKFTYKIQSLDPKIYKPALAPSNDLAANFEKHKLTGTSTNDGDLTNVSNLKDYVAIFKSNSMNLVNIATADGGMDIGDNFATQEQTHYKLFLGEIVVAINALARNGSFVLKTYHLTTATSFSMVLILNLLFTKLIIHKPKTSRSRNDEKYIICSEFVGQKNQKLLDQITNAIYEYIDSEASNYEYWIPFRINSENELGVIKNIYDKYKLISREFIDEQKKFIGSLLSKTHSYYCDKKLVASYIKQNQLL